MNIKTLGFIIFGVGIVLSATTLLFMPVPVYGLYLLLTVYKPDMGKIARIVIAIIGAFVAIMAVATLISFILY